MDNLKQVKDMMKMVLVDDEYHELQAKLTERKFSALIEEGFTRNEAIQIVANQTSGA